MKPQRLLTVLALTAWGGALLPLPSGGRSFLLVDASDSVGGAAAAAALLEIERGPGPQRRYVFGVRPDAGTGAPLEATPLALGAAGSPLGAALRGLRPRLRRGDTLAVWSDGRATDELPAAGIWAGVQVLWRQPPPRPRIAAVDAPPAWPAAGQLEIEVRLADADSASGSLEVETRPASVATGALEWLGADALRLVLSALQPPETAVELRLTWVQGTRRDRHTRVIAGAGRTAFWSPDPGVRAALAQRPELDAVADYSSGVAVLAAVRDVPGAAAASTVTAVAGWLEQGSAVVLCSPRAADWLELRQRTGFTPFVPAPAPGAECVLVLDRSGSMAETPHGARTPWEQACAAVADWSRWWPADAGLRVFPFAEEAGPAFDPRTPDGARRLREELQPAGPTRLAAALERLLPALGEDAAVVILSDGRVEEAEPDADWRGLGRRLASGGRAVRCVPVGPQADARVLAQLGTVVDAAGTLDLRERLLQALSAPLRTGAGASHPEPGALWTLPAAPPALAERDRFAAAAGAETLLRDDSGAVAAAALRARRGVLVGIAAEPGAEWAGAFAPLVQEQAAQPRLERAGGRVRLRGRGAGWMVQVDGADGPLLQRPLDPVGPDLWEVQGVPAELPVLVQGAGRAWSLPAEPPDEHTAPDQAWRDWLEAQRRAPPPRRPVAPLLGLGLICAVAALGCERRGRHMSQAAGVLSRHPREAGG
ncbi:MAG: VWA domain-containing protein [Planctomycetota bacterium]|nr:MAG: VWA domain-containing protein [Planctomycetota bacterium]